MHSIEIPPRSPALHELWKRSITSAAGDASNAAFTALRLEALFRSGLARAAAAEIAKNPGADNDPLLMSLEARNELAAGHPDKACEMVTRAAAQKGNIPARLKGQVILMAGYCSAIHNDTAAAGLAADMAREEGVEASPGLQALDALSINSKPKFKAAKEVSLLDYRIAERVGGLPLKDGPREGRAGAARRFGDGSVDADRSRSAGDGSRRTSQRPDAEGTCGHLPCQCRGDRSRRLAFGSGTARNRAPRRTFQSCRGRANADAKDAAYPRLSR